jgi:acyl-coenzyme A thioesterase PaaI-like protein
MAASLEAMKRMIGNAARLIQLISRIWFIVWHYKGPQPALALPVPDGENAALIHASCPGDPMKAFQEYYPENVAHCYGCGRLNHAGHQIKTYWDGDETLTRFQPGPEHTAIPGFVYGGLLASLIDCHCTGTAAAAMYRAENRPMDSLPAFRFVTGSLHVDYLKPTPLGPELQIRGRIKEIRGRKVIVEAEVSADGVVTARGEVVAVQMPDSFKA